MLIHSYIIADNILELRTLGPPALIEGDSVKGVRKCEQLLERSDH